MRNTAVQGSATIFIYKSAKKYIGVCLELDLVDDGDTREEVAERMKQNVVSYVAYIRKRHFDKALLNRPAPKKYWKKFFQYLQLIGEEEKTVRNIGKKDLRRHRARVRDFTFYRQPLASSLS